MFAPPMNMTCSIITTYLDDYSAYKETNRTEVKCHFRLISLESQSRLYEAKSAAMIWLPVDAPVSVGTAIEYQGQAYRVARFIEAQGLRTEPQFLKCELEITTLVEV